MAKGAQGPEYRRALPGSGPRLDGFKVSRSQIHVPRTKPLPFIHVYCLQFAKLDEMDGGGGRARTVLMW